MSEPRPEGRDVETRGLPALEDVRVPSFDDALRPDAEAPPPTGRREAPVRPDLLEKLRCLACGTGQLCAGTKARLRCETCGQSYPLVRGLPFLFPPDELEEHLRADAERRREDDWQERVPTGGRYHWDVYDIPSFLPPAGEGRDVLLLGCGDAGERERLEDLGYRVYGFDVRRTGGTDFLADAHVIPMADASVDLVLSMQVLEHLRAPWRAAREIGRVLRPGGAFVGSVAFLKPYHSSYFHMTHDGVAALLEDEAGLETERVRGAQSLTYTLYGSLFPVGPAGLRRRVLGAVDAVVRRLRGWYWGLTRGASPDEPTSRFGTREPMSFRDFDDLRYAPAVVFRAVKPEA